MQASDQNEDAVGHSRTLSIEVEMCEVSPFLTIMREQLAAAVKDTEAGAIAVISQINAVHHTARQQLNQFKALHNPSCDDQIATHLVETLEAATAEMEGRLAEALGFIQFQDVVRQRVEHVQQGLEELDNHLRELIRAIKNPDWSGSVKPSLQERLAAHANSYVMKSQRDTHLAATGGYSMPGSSADEEDDGPKIELF